MKNTLFPHKFLFFLTLVIAIFLFSPASSLHTKMAPDFSLSDTQNNLFDLSDFTGKIVSKKYGVIQIPTIVIITPSGEVSYKHIGKITPFQLSMEIEKARRGKISSSIFYLPLPLIAFIGVLSFFSPCSFPLLPAYMAYYIGKGVETKNGLGKAILEGIKPALGIMAFYGIIGIPIIFAGNMAVMGW